EAPRTRDSSHRRPRAALRLPGGERGLRPADTRPRRRAHGRARGAAPALAVARWRLELRQAARGRALVLHGDPDPAPRPRAPRPARREPPLEAPRPAGGGGLPETGSLQGCAGRKADLEGLPRAPLPVLLALRRAVRPQGHGR